MPRIKKYAVVVAAVLITSPLLLAQHANVALAAPTATVSRYEYTVDTNTLWYQGRAQHDTSGVVELDFGEPWYLNGAYDVYNWYGSYFSIAQIEAAAESWMQGWYETTGNHSNHIYLAIGENTDFGYTGYSDGAIWAQMINAINAWIDSPPSWAASLGAVGAIDAETEWNNVSAAEAWANGYAANYSCANHNCNTYYDFGDAGGCPTSYTGANSSCNTGWHQYDVWYMAWKTAPAWPMPETYYNHLGFQANAASWEAISLDAAYFWGGAMYPIASLTQWAAAQGCCGTDTPSEGWSGLQAAMNSNPKTAATLLWSSDQTKQN